MSIYPQPPGGIYLCQEEESFSCGACCGLYNVATPTRSYLTHILIDRTERFVNVDRDIEAIESFKAETLRREKNHPPLKDFHHCPYIGFIDPERLKVGCLLHPLGKGNSAIDWRGLSEYGGWACACYFCPTYTTLPPRWKKIVLAISSDWYRYGAIITESNLLSAFFHLVEEALQRTLEVDMVKGNASVTDALNGFIDLKWQWPFRSKHFPAITHYFFKTPEEYHRPVPTVAEQASTSMHQSTYDVLFRELVSDFPSREQRAAAIQMIDMIIIRIKRSYASLGYD